MRENCWIELDSAGKPWLCSRFRGEVSRVYLDASDMNTVIRPHRTRRKKVQRIVPTSEGLQLRYYLRNWLKKPGRR